jgi:hypothetical protein
VLLTSGCSFVWGDELEGYDTDPPSHWHHTFTHKLAEHLGVEYVNLGTCGGCNQKIFRDVMHYLNDAKTEDPTHIVIIWSAWQREELSENHPEEYDKKRKVQRFQCMTQISPSRVDTLKKELRVPLDRLYEHYDVTRTGIIRTLSYMEAMSVICEAKGIKLIQGTFHELAYRNLLDKMHRRNRNMDWGEWMNWVEETINRMPDTSLVGLGKYEDLYSVGRRYKLKPYGHPCEDAQTEYAKLLHHIFTTKWED